MKEIVSEALVLNSFSYASSNQVECAQRPSWLIDLLCLTRLNCAVCTRDIRLEMAHGRANCLSVGFLTGLLSKVSLCGEFMNRQLMKDVVQ